MNEDDYYYLEEETDNRPFLEDVMQDPSNAADDEDNYDRDDDVDDSYFDSDALASAGWGTDEDYGHFGYDDDGGAW
jgi:hypothetical protein